MYKIGFRYGKVYFGAGLTNPALIKAHVSRIVFYKKTVKKLHFSFLGFSKI